jgi:hypothetical protein
MGLISMGTLRLLLYGLINIKLMRIIFVSSGFIVGDLLPCYPLFSYPKMIEFHAPPLNPVFWDFGEVPVPILNTVTRKLGKVRLYNFTLCSCSAGYIARAERSFLFAQT